MFATTFARNLAASAVAAVFATTCLTVAVAPAAAANVAPTLSKTVSYADLNLGSAQGRAALQQRIKSAARTVCKVDAADLNARTSESRCVKTAIATATAS